MTIITHPDYDLSLKHWQLVKDASSLTGVKDKGVKYLPMIGDPKDDDTKVRYETFLQRAVYYGFTQETVGGLLGLSYRNGATVNDVDDDHYINSNVDGNGVSVEQQAKGQVRIGIKYGRGGLLVDYPQVEGTKTRQQENDEAIRATILSYDAISIKNWATINRNGENLLSLISLCEQETQRGEDGLTTEVVNIERRLILDEDGYRQEVYEDGEQEPRDVFEPKIDGRRLNRIPFYFIGSEENDYKIDESPIFPIADLNIAHYRDSADLQNLALYTGSPVPVFTGLNDAWIKDHMQDVKIGGGAAVMTPEGGDFKFSEVKGSNLIQTMMKDKVELLVAMGAKLLTGEINFNTRSQAVMAKASETSKLETLISNVEDAYNKALETLALFNKEPAATITIDADLESLGADPEVIKPLLESWMAGLVAKEIPLNYMRKVGITDDSIEDLAAAATDEHGENGNVDLDGE